MKNLLRTAAIVLAFSFASGCKATADKNAAPAAMINSVCLISGEALDASSPTVDYMGGKVGFCCDNCVGKWNKMTDAQKKAAVDAKK
jgi:hypothetical protein